MAKKQSAIKDLLSAYGKLEVHLDGCFDTDRTSARRHMADFLVVLGDVADKLDCALADRSHRAAFPKPYARLYPVDQRCYRFEILKACLDGTEGYEINGARFRLSTESLHMAQVLDMWHFELSDLLFDSRLGCFPASLCDVSRIRDIISAFDWAWISFERSYIREKVKIEERSRLILLDAIDEEQYLQEIEKSESFSREQLCSCERLVSYIGRINSVANVRRKGRDDLGFEILLRARDVQAESHSPYDAVRHIADGVVESFRDLRQYLDAARHCIDKIAVDLALNPGLVKLLESWEQSWELGARFLLDERISAALRHVYREVQLVKFHEPAFADMLDTYSAESFLVLPRILWVIFLQNPRITVPLIQDLLPECFETASERQKMQVFVNKLQFLKITFLQRHDASVSCEEPSTSFMRVLLWNVVHGWGLQNHVSPVETLASVELRAFLCELEGWSMHLQRSRPEAWNSCSAVMMQSLTKQISSSGFTEGSIP